MITAGGLMGAVGRSVPRKEGKAKVTGEARYVDDLFFPDMIHGATVRSPLARGILKNISFAGGVPWDEFTIVTAEDIPGNNHVTFFENDQPYLVDKCINHPEEPIVLLAHPDIHILEKGRASVTFEIEPLKPIFTIEDSLNKKEIVWGKDNLFKSFLIEKGNVDALWDKADFIVEDCYFTGAQEQLYIECQGMIAMADRENGVTVWGSLQCPYYVHRALAPLFNLPEHKVRVIQTETGGAFGGKEEYPSMIAGHAALLSWKSGKPVKLVYSRSEDMAATTKRHPSRTKIRSAVSRAGKLLAQEIEFVIDGGAYMTLSPVVLSRGTIHACGPYFCENVRIRSAAVATNNPPNGAFRGFGAPQSIFAIERHMDKIAREIGMTPDSFRRQNFIRRGQTTATSQVIRERVDFDQLMNKAFDLSDYARKLREFSNHNQSSRIKKGIGFSCFMHGAGFTGSGEKHLASVAGIEATPEGKVRVLSSSTEMGQGTNTIFAQIAADALGLDYETVEVAQPDTANVPDSGPTVASRTCMIVGKLVERAALGFQKTLMKSGHLKEKYSEDDFKKACRNYHQKIGPLRIFSRYQQPPHISWDDKNHRGDAYSTYAWAVYVAQISVDCDTYETHVDHFTAVQEVGSIVHPVMAAGQIEGGVAQAIGYALHEKVVWEEGHMLNNRMTDYIMPTARDIPPIQVHFEQWNKEYGPGGAKGIGELPMDGPAPAILNAVENALGVSVKRIPMLPEDLMMAVRNAG